jgi:hypothetical protein
LNWYSALRMCLEKMLAHQLAAAHRSAMKLTAQLNRAVERMQMLYEERRATANGEASRLVGSIARMMGAYQQGALALRPWLFPVPTHTLEQLEHTTWGIGTTTNGPARAPVTLC